MDGYANFTGVESRNAESEHARHEILSVSKKSTMLWISEAYRTQTLQTQRHFDNISNFSAYASFDKERRPREQIELRHEIC